MKPKAWREGSNEDRSVSRDSETLRLTQTSFPGREHLIEDAFRSQRFRELCEDYRRCDVALDRWNREEESVTTQRCEEYSELLKELGQEIETWLEDAETESPPTNRRTA